ncbi:hypothetical protein R2F25_37970 [Streptomyces sp. UP1A-1]|nr:hypothetical protein [Streptomyces sp. UP1A-1]
MLLLPGPPASGEVRRLARVEMPGMRGARFHGLRLADVRLPDSALVGSLGEGVTLALRSFQISHCLIPGTVLAGVDSVLRLAVRAATENRPDGRPARRWHKALSGVFADLLACDAMAVTGLRALSLVPQHAHLLAAAVKYTMPDLLREDLEELAAVLGARGYDRGPLYGGFQKLARDLPVAGLGHSGTAVCQAVLVPQLLDPGTHGVVPDRRAERRTVPAGRAAATARPPQADALRDRRPAHGHPDRGRRTAGRTDGDTTTARRPRRAGPRPGGGATGAARALRGPARPPGAPCSTRWPAPWPTATPCCCAPPPASGSGRDRRTATASSPTRPGRCSSSAASAADSASPYPRHRRTRNRRSWPRRWDAAGTAAVSTCTTPHWPS